MFEELVERVRKLLHEKIGVFIGETTPGVTYSEESCKTILSYYMTNFIETLVREYHRENDCSEDCQTEHTFDSVLSALRNRGISYKLCVPPLQASFTHEGIDMCLEKTKKNDRICIDNKIDCEIKRWDPAIVLLMDCIIDEYQWACSDEFNYDYRERCKKCLEQKRMIESMIRNTVNTLISNYIEEMVLAITDLRIDSNDKVIIRLMAIRYDEQTTIKCSIANLPTCINKALIRLKGHGRHQNKRANG